MIYARVPYFYQYSSFSKSALNCLFYYPTCQNLFSDNRHQVVVLQEVNRRSCKLKSSWQGSRHIRVGLVPSVLRSSD